VYHSLRHGQINILRKCVGTCVEVESIFNPIKYIKIIIFFYLYINLFI